MKRKKFFPTDRMVYGVFGKEQWHYITVPLFSIILSLLAGALLLLLLGKNPFWGYVSLLQGAGILPKENYAAGKGMFTDFMSMLDAMTPMIYAALAVAVAFKGGLFNIGVSGQMLFSGYLATILIGYSELPALLAKPAVLVIGMLGGAFVGGLIGILKYKFNINEVVSAIMINYILQYIVSFLIYNFSLDPISRQSVKVNNAARLSLTEFHMGIQSIVLPMGFFLALAAVFFVSVLIRRTRLGYELKITGASSRAAEYAGIHVGKTIVTTMMISGALAGLAGVTYYLGYFASIQPRTLPSTGFDAIAVSLLGNASASGVLLASLLVTVITKGSTYMTSVIGVPGEIISVITGLLLLFSACGTYIRRIAGRSHMKIESHKVLKGGDH